MHLDNWKEADNMFIKTRAADEVYTMIKSNSCLTVTGNSGIGKTMAVRHVALTMLEEGYIIVPISHPEEIVTLFSTQRKILFVVDDLCGKYTLNQGYLDRLKLKLEDIQLILDKHHCKMIATCRFQVYQDVKFKTLSIFNMCECNFSSKDLYLTSKEITIFAAKYFGEHTKKAKSLSEQYDCFPLLCSLYHQNKGADFDVFCKNPFNFFGMELDNLLLEGDEGKYKYCALALCVIYNNNLSESRFEGTSDRNTREIFEGVLDVCELNRGTSPKCLHKSLQTLVGTFVTKEEHFFRMIHDKLFDFISFHLGQNMIHILIKHADSGFIRERFLWNTVDTKEQGVDFTITISDAVVDSYIDRMIKDLTNRKVVDFFDNRNLKSSVFTDKVIFHFNELDKDRRLKLASVLDDGRYHDTPLMRSSFAGNMKLTQWILNHGANVNQCNELDELSPLQLACQEGYLQIARHLLQHSADINKCNVDGWSPLHAACACDHKDVVSELLKNNKVKINVCTNDGRSPLYMACERGNDKIVIEIIQLRPDINNCNKKGKSPLNIACCNGYTNVVAALLMNDTLKVDSCDIEGYSSLYIACQKGYAEIVRDLVQRGADINKCDNNGFSPLHTACYNGHKEVVSELLENDSVKIDFGSNMGCSSLYLACQEGYAQIVGDLLQHGADINKSRHNSWSPLHTACYKGHLDVVTELLKSDNVKIDLCDNERCSSLYLACQQAYVEIVRELLQHGADVNNRDNHGWSPLRTACFNGHIDIVTELLKNDDVTIDLCDNNGCSPLYVACNRRYVQIVRYLIQHDANINKSSSQGWSPLHTSCDKEYEDVVTELLNNDNVEIDALNNTLYSPLYMACSGGNTQIVNELLEHGADVNKYTEDGWSPLHIACYFGFEDVVTALLKNEKVRIDIYDKNGCSPLHLACKEGYVHTVRELLQHGADVNKRDNNGSTPIRTAACSEGHADVVNELLKNINVKIDECDEWGSTLLFLACQKGNSEIVKEFVQHEADSNKSNRDGWSPLCIACYIGNTDVVIELLKSDGLDIDLCGNNDCSPLYFACQYGFVQIVEIMLQHGANINKVDEDGLSPLHIACYNGHIDVVIALLENDNVQVDLCDDLGRTSLTVSYQTGHMQITSELLQNGANIKKCKDYRLLLLKVLPWACQNGLGKIVTELLQLRENLRKCTQDALSPSHTACYYDKTEVKQLQNNDVWEIDLCDYEGCSTLYLACSKGYIHIVRDLIKNGVDVNKCTHDGRSALHSACYGGHLDVVTELLKNDNVKIDLCDNEEYSPLCLACEKGYVQIVRDLLQHGADINKCNEDCESPFYISCLYGHREVVTEILKNDNVKIDLCDNEGYSPLYLACEVGYAYIVRDILQHGADINKCNEDGESPLFISCYYGHREVVTELLKNDNVKIDLCDNEGYSPLFLACKKGYVQIVRELLQHGADINQCRHGWSLLQSACYYKQLDIVTELLKDDKVKVDLCCNEGRSPLYMVCQGGHVQIARALLQNGADINKCDEDGWSPLHASCYFGQNDVVTELLMNENVEIDLCDTFGRSSLMLACQVGYVQIVNQLLQHGVDIKKCENDGQPLLVMALQLKCQDGFEKMITELIQHGADVNKCTQHGISPLHTVCYFDKRNALRLLLKANDLQHNSCDNQGRSSLYMACQQGHVQIVRELLLHGADVNRCTCDGWSPLHIASYYGRNDIVVELLNTNNVKIDLCDAENCSSLYLACQEGYDQVVRSLLHHAADINKCTQNSLSPLHTSCANGHTNVLISLLENNDVKVDSCDYQGRSPLYLACKEGYGLIVRKLLQHGADINKCNDHGISSLQIACINHRKLMEEEHDKIVDLFRTERHADIIGLLLERGANVNKCSNTGESSLFVSCVTGTPGIVEMLLYRDADVNLCIKSKDVYMKAIRKYQNAHIHEYKRYWMQIRNYAYDRSLKCIDGNDEDDWIIDITAGASPLHIACFMGHVEVVKLLLEKNLNINMTKDDGSTPLFVACELGHEGIVTLLLSKGADATICRQDEKSPYNIAQDNRHIYLLPSLSPYTHGVEMTQRQTGTSQCPCTIV